VAIVTRILLWLQNHLENLFEIGAALVVQAVL
jgi:hypothetical protein